MPEPQRGEIYWVDFDRGRGSEQRGQRPALIVQNDVGNRLASTTIVVALTTRLREPTPPHQVFLGADITGLPRDSMAKCDQVLTLSKERLLRRAGRLDAPHLSAVDGALRYSLGLT